MSKSRASLSALAALIAIGAALVVLTPDPTPPVNAESWQPLEALRGRSGDTTVQPSPEDHDALIP